MYYLTKYNMSDTTPTNGTIEKKNVEVEVTPEQGNIDYKKLYESTEKQRRDNQSYYTSKLSAREEILKKDYGEDPSRIHSIADEATRNELVKLVFPDLSKSENPYQEATKLGRLTSSFDVDEQIKTEKVKSMFSVAKQYDPALADNEDKFFQYFDATNPKLPAEERFKLASEITKLRLGVNNQVTTPVHTPITTDQNFTAPPAPVTVTTQTEIKQKEKEEMSAMFEAQAKELFQKYSKK